MKIKKSLGQNFLKSNIALKKMIEVGEVKSSDTILEIGPGRGVLTEKLLETGAKIVAVEKDYELFEFLKNKFSRQIKSGTLVLINEDILNFSIISEFSKFFSGPRPSGSLPQPDHVKNLKIPPYKIIANIPYNITGAILKKFLTENNQPESMTLMVQKEVVKRIVASDGKESILSISVKAYGDPKMVMKVPARYFSPKPKVDSAIVTIKNISREKLVNLAGQQVDEEKFWEIVKTGFSHKRKKLGGNLKSIISSTKLAQNLITLKIGDKRAENLTLLDWIALASVI